MRADQPQNTAPSPSLPDWAANLRACAPALPLAVAYSGGADSTALLHACTRLWPGQMCALHVHHGLQAAAADFLAHAQHQCARLNVPLYHAQVAAHPAAGQSPEEAARKARYRALAQLARSVPAPYTPASIVLAQHADDQVETVLLALSRGAGLPGLAAMPAAWQAEGLQWQRPLLGVPGASLRAWLQSEGITWVEDPSNTDTRYTRNRIRHSVLPALAAAFPSFRETFARSSAHAAQAQALLAEIAQADLAHIGCPPAIAALQAFSPARQANVLRHWLQQHCSTQASSAQLAQLQNQISACTTRGHRISIKLGSGRIERAGQHLQFIANNPSLTA